MECTPAVTSVVCGLHAVVWVARRMHTVARVAHGLYAVAWVARGLLVGCMPSCPAA